MAFGMSLAASSSIAVVRRRYLASDDLGGVRLLCDRLIVLRTGHIVEPSTTEQLLPP